MTGKPLSDEERRRYSRQIAIESIGLEGQMKLKRGKVFVVGCGALGSMVAMQLCAAGVGEIHIADFDTIDVSNLQRQLFFSTGSCGLPKAGELQKRMHEINPEVQVIVHPEMVTASKARDLFAAVDFIVDGSDNPETKYMTEQVCTHLGKSCCLAGVSRISGQLMTCTPGSTRFSEIVPPGISGGLLPCSVAGVMGPAAAVAASLQASECIKSLTGTGDLLINKLLTFDLQKNIFNVLSC